MTPNKRQRQTPCFPHFRRFPLHQLTSKSHQPHTKFSPDISQPTPVILSVTCQHSAYNNAIHRTPHATPSKHRQNVQDVHHPRGRPAQDREGHVAHCRERRLRHHRYGDHLRILIIMAAVGPQFPPRRRPPSSLSLSLILITAHASSPSPMIYSVC